MGGITNSLDISLGNLRELVVDRESLRAAVYVFTKIQTERIKLNLCTEHVIAKFTFKLRKVGKTILPFG